MTKLISIKNRQGFSISALSVRAAGSGILTPRFAFQFRQPVGDAGIFLPQPDQLVQLVHGGRLLAAGNAFLDFLHLPDDGPELV